MELRQNIYIDRSNQLLRVCRQFNMSGGAVNQQFLQRDILLNMHYKLAYCPNGKTGTSTWMNNFEKMEPLPQNLVDSWTKKLHNYMRNLYNLPEKLTTTEKMELLNDSLKVTFVRHPFVRLVSAFQDKTRDHNYRDWKLKSLRYPSGQKVFRAIFVWK